MEIVILEYNFSVVKNMCYLAILSGYRVIRRLLPRNRLDISSSSPPQPQYLLENPFTYAHENTKYFLFDIPLFIGNSINDAKYT